MPNSVVEEVPVFTKAEDFLAAISLNGPSFVSSSIHEWCFRGHGCSSYRLVPTVLRSGSWNRFYRLAFCRDWNHAQAPYEMQQVAVECQLLWRFNQAVNDAGLVIPGFSQYAAAKLAQYTRHAIDHSVTFDACMSMTNLPPPRVFDQNSLVPLQNPWPLGEWYSALAVARHAGLPTRLLDWTFIPQIAAYFAAVGAIKHLEAAGKSHCCGNVSDAGHKLDVWALRCCPPVIKPLIPRTQPNAEKMKKLHKLSSLVTIRTPYADSQKMFVQRGLFTVRHVDFHDLGHRVDRSSIDEFISDNIPETASVERHMYRFSLVTSQAKHLLHLLHKEGFTAGHLFPSYEGAVDEIEEQLYVDEARYPQGRFVIRPANAGDFDVVDLPDEKAAASPSPEAKQ